VEFAGLTDALIDPEAELTVLAPDNRAFERTLADLGLTAGELLTEDNRDLVTQILLYHVIDGAAPSSAVRRLAGSSVPTLQGDEIDVDLFFGFFIQLNEDVFVTDPDNFASNGVVHGINRVLLPPSLFAEEETLYDRLEADPDFSTLVAALQFAGLDGVLDDPEVNLTLLAPNNRAFERTLAELGLTAGELLTEDNRDLVTQILLYHVIDGAVDSAAVRAADDSDVPTLQGESISIDVIFRRFILINDDTFVRRTDVEADNGVAHDISRVLLPPSAGL
jgi:uncharacterized surface protein with fasciclin (FAS1) repeats